MFPEGRPHRTAPRITPEEFKRMDITFNGIRLPGRTWAWSKGVWHGEWTKAHPASGASVQDNPFEFRSERYEHGEWRAGFWSGFGA